MKKRQNILYKYNNHKKHLTLEKIFTSWNNYTSKQPLLRIYNKIFNLWKINSKIRFNIINIKYNNKLKFNCLKEWKKCYEKNQYDR